MQANQMVKMADEGAKSSTPAWKLVAGDKGDGHVRFKLVFLVSISLGSAMFVYVFSHWMISTHTAKTAAVNQHIMRNRTKDTRELEFPRLYPVPSCKRIQQSLRQHDTCWNLRVQNMSQRSRQTYLRLLQYFDKMAAKNNWTYFIAFGTLLGSWRHHDVIPWDLDMDIMVDYNNRMDIVNQIDAQERFVAKQGVHHKIRLHDNENVFGTRYVPDEGRWFKPSIDMFFYKQNATHIFRSDYPTDPVYILKRTGVFPLHQRPLSTLSLPSPLDPLLILVKWYNATNICEFSHSPLRPSCKEFLSYLHFVHRQFIHGAMEETLMRNEKILQVVNVKEMETNIPLNPYTLASRIYIPTDQQIIRPVLSETNSFSPKIG